VFTLSVSDTIHRDLDSSGKYQPEKFFHDKFVEKGVKEVLSQNDHEVRKYSKSEGGGISPNDFETEKSSMNVYPNRGSSRIKSRDTYSYGQTQPFSFSHFPENTGSYPRPVGGQHGSQHRDQKTTYYSAREPSKNDFTVGQSFRWLVSPPTKYIFSNNTGGVVGCQVDGLFPAPEIVWTRENGHLLNRVSLFGYCFCYVHCNR